MNGCKIFKVVCKSYIMSRRTVWSFLLRLCQNKRRVPLKLLICSKSNTIVRGKRISDTKTRPLQYTPGLFASCISLKHAVRNRVIFFQILSITKAVAARKFTQVLYRQTFSRYKNGRIFGNHCNRMKKIIISTHAHRYSSLYN